MAASLEQLIVLLVEPSKAQHKIIESHLRNIGVNTVLWATTGTQALTLLASESPELLVCSMHLEDMTGTDLILKVRTGNVKRDIPCILVSSETDYRYLEPIRQAGIIATLPKPFEQYQLEKAIYATLDYCDPEKLALNNIPREEFKVLLIDDSDMSRRHIRHLLENMGLENISEAENGAIGLKMVNQNFYDLIVTDYYMPEMDGEELIERIRSNSPQSSVPILMVSSETDESRLAGVKQAGVSAICDKPFDARNIKQLIENIID
jgi:two-component system chemotaxis response regulator CheY